MFLSGQYDLLSFILLGSLYICNEFPVLSPSLLEIPRVLSVFLYLPLPTDLQYQVCLCVFVVNKERENRKECRLFVLGYRF